MTKRVAVLTSGGDAPGMNAAIRAVVRCGLAQGWQMYGVRSGYKGLISGNIESLSTRDVGGIMQKGGTMLGSARAPEFKQEEGRKLAIRSLNQHGIDVLVVIGGNGSQTGNHALYKMGFNTVGIASTIDNDLIGSDMTIGFDTALNIALEAIDRLKVTATSHQRAFVLEVMGRNCGYLALMAGLAGGAEAITVPEVPTDPEALAQEMISAYERGKAHALIVAAEGAEYNAAKLTQFFDENKDRLGFSVRSTTLGHVQRGGAPSAFDRILATRLGDGAIKAIERDLYGVLVGQLKGEIAYTPLDEIVGRTKSIDPEMLRLANLLD